LAFPYRKKSEFKYLSKLQLMLQKKCKKLPALSVAFSLSSHKDIFKPEILDK
jgi:hypothetical protein